MFQHLLVPIDDSELSIQAMTASLELAARLGASITGLIVEPAVGPSSTGRSAAHYLSEIEDETRQVESHARDVMRGFELKAASHRHCLQRPLCAHRNDRPRDP